MTVETQALRTLLVTHDGQGVQAKGRALDALLDAHARKLEEAEKTLDSAVMLSNGVVPVPFTELDQRWQALVVEWGKRLERAQSAEASLARLREKGKAVVEWGEGIQGALNEACRSHRLPLHAVDPALDAFKAEINKEGV